MNNHILQGASKILEASGEISVNKSYVIKLEAEFW